jgi:hypothetical protein
MLLVFAFAYAGCTALCLSMNRHFQQVLPNRNASPKTILALRLSGWLLLTIAMVYCANYQGVAIALVSVCGVVTAAAFLLVLLLSYTPRFAIILATIAPILGVIN